MTREERELSIEYLEGIKDNYIEGYGYERHPIPEYYAIEHAIKALEQELILDKVKAEIEDFEINGHIRDVECFRAGINVALNVIDKYRSESGE